MVYFIDGPLTVTTSTLVAIMSHRVLSNTFLRLLPYNISNFLCFPSSYTFLELIFLAYLTYTLVSFHFAVLILKLFDDVIWPGDIIAYKES